jgi:hypothetical protein
MRVYLHGNCQMSAMASLLREQMTDWTIDVNEVPLAQLDRDENFFVSCLRQADIVIAQPVSPRYRGAEWLGSDFVRAEARRDAQLLMVPSVFFRGHLPEWFYLGRSEERLIVQGCPYHNVVVANAVLHDWPTAQIMDRVSSVLQFGKHFVDARVAECLDELRTREDVERIDVPVSDLIAAMYQSGALMSSIDHPMRRLLAAVLNRALAMVSEPRRIAEVGPAVLDGFVLPTAPAVAACLGHRLSDSTDMVVAGRRVAVADYLRGAIAEYRAMSPGHLAVALFGNPHVRGFLSAQARHDRDGNPLDIGTSANIIRGLYQVLLDRLPGPKEILSHLRVAEAQDGRAVIERFLSSREFRERRGHLPAALQD